MGRASSLRNKLILTAVVAVLAIGGLGSWAYATSRQHAEAKPATTQQRQNNQSATQISYPGKDGTDALTLLKQHATVQTKHYSFGDMVVSINGVAGNGPKYWTFYVNGKSSNIGAGAYTTKNSDTLMWKLQ